MFIKLVANWALTQDTPVLGRMTIIVGRLKPCAERNRFTIGCSITYWPPRVRSRYRQLNERRSRPWRSFPAGINIDSFKHVAARVNDLVAGGASPGKASGTGPDSQLLTRIIPT